MKVIIADDHKMFADLLRDFVNNLPSFEVVGIVTNGKELLQTLNRLQPDIILLDIDMPLIDGIEAAKCIKQKFKKIKIIFISMHYNVITKKCIDELNIDGFIAKHASALLLKDAFSKIEKGERVFLTTPTQQICNEQESFGEGIKKYKLTENEIDLIKLIAAGNSSKMIADKRKRALDTIEKQRSIIMKKLNAKNMNEVVAFAVSNNLV